ncbi:hypothetical protein PHYBLDRAFT_150648 [Phycomyces blakesleeanus NRRL 1555(-)]|uniref:Tc1-like transposase DDE domain-containing protein n=1 Tax=Phycomyces blakesleeanus (strain ATCC 8743b / DSM 1359 / FGSC 10004 / NBRC 33097 / NRRL 1555) TaxID=763407 RepID=A0A167KN84_PHYB8|nr:hypothetical protein PHYBLDRAFT_150648 [Phycomyces blakesleeanus NRRL 1555(-)]OAD68477.1 hypothetical protein PHYBLDRAFT_150648 [Phycomyces blakesleeanus NRRL 1555(-)]|eukprot:XP_018286517.1 hypothetical protein PHYBLDRAFT_150648 [Phycomyces blakesleeanus NRRL 1555(-)]
MTTSHKAFVNGCGIDSSFAQTPLREAHHVCLQVQVDLFCNVRQSVLVAKNEQMKLKVVYLADVKELVGLVVSDAISSTTTTTATTKYIVWPELNCLICISLKNPKFCKQPFSAVLGEIDKYANMKGNFLVIDNAPIHQNADISHYISSRRYN